MNILSREEQEIIFDKDTFSIYPLDKDTAMKLKEINPEDREQIYEIIKGEDLRGSRESAVNLVYNGLRCGRLIIITCQDCNLRCKYCYAQQGDYGEDHIEKCMSFDTYKKSIEFILTEFPDGVQSIQFFGGEPLLNFDLIEESCSWTVAYFKDRNIEKPHFSIVTNGTILTDKIIDLFNKYNISVTISLDGNKEVNDINRIYKGSNKSVFDTIEKNVNYLNQKRKFRMGFEVTVDKANIEQFKRKKELLDIEKLICLKPDFLHIVPAQWSDNCSEGGIQKMDPVFKKDFIEYFDTLSDMFFDKTLKNEIQLTATYDLLAKIKNKRLKVNFCGAGITDFSINTRGDIYPCFVFTGIDKFKLGNVHTYQDSNNFKNITELFRSITYEKADKCSKCWASGLCHSCIGLNFLTSGNLETPSESTCTSQKALIKGTIFKCAEVISIPKLT